MQLTLLLWMMTLVQCGLVSANGAIKKLEERYILI